MQRPGRLVALLAVAAGVSVANLYYAQPLASVMARSLGVREATIGVALTLTQVGYALGMLLLVPLGDGRERRAVIVATGALAAVSLLFVAASPTFAVLAGTSLLLGFASSLPQMLLPYAVGVVGVEARGAAIGTVMGGLLAGILLSRTASGALGAAFGWRTTFVIASALMAVLTIVLRAVLPPQRPAEPIRWAQTIRSLGAIARGEPVLRRHAFVGALGFGSFSVLWSTLAFHLADRGHGPATAGLFGVLGVAGIVVAPIASRLAVRIDARAINAIGLASAALAFLVAGLGGASLAAIGAAVVLLDAGVQASHLANQTVIFGLRAELRNRLNAIYMVSYFAGGALGTAIASLAWSAGRWPLVCVSGAALALLGCAPLVATRRSSPVRS